MTETTTRTGAPAATPDVLEQHAEHLRTACWAAGDRPDPGRYRLGALLDDGTPRPSVWRVRFDDLADLPHALRELRLELRAEPGTAVALSLEHHHRLTGMQVTVVARDGGVVRCGATGAARSTDVTALRPRPGSVVALLHRPDEVGPDRPATGWEAGPPTSWAAPRRPLAARLAAALGLTPPSRARRAAGAASS